MRSRPWFGDPEGALEEGLRERYRRLSRFRFDGVEVLLFDREQGPATETPERADGSAGNDETTAEPDSVESGPN